ncbi:hypothetical protein AADC60_08080 [Cytobacillus pseudoceanisediminis]|uniref:Uncharacterized protein n=1 Tax=Cytobacillus pseudoceanisediminis TaxID=3051614 RepID=A0ABZ2ZMT0_9BACI
MKYPDYFGLIGKLNKEEINFEQYLKGRGLKKANKLTALDELIPLINGKPNVINLFLSKTSIGVRCLVMKTIFGLSDRQILENVSIGSRSVIGDFIKENLEIVELNNYPAAKSLRNFSSELIRELSIILDLPNRYLADPYAELKLLNTFEEYERANIKTSLLKTVINESIMELNDKSLKIEQDDKVKYFRKIYGIKLENSFIKNVNAAYFYTRIDVRKNFFTVEVYLENDQVIKMDTIIKIKKLLKGLDVSGKIYFRDAFLRVNKKLIIMIWIEEEFPKPHYLNELLLLENQLF